VIAVSGASGFLGSYVVCSLIEQGKQVRAFKRAETRLDEFTYIFSNYFKQRSIAEQQHLHARIQWVIADVTDVTSLDEALQGIEEIYHCAAIVSFAQKDKSLLMKVNAEGTANMVNIALQHGVKKFCHVSSIAALGRTDAGNLITEQTQWMASKHNSNYAISKYKAEMEVWRGAAEGLNVTVVNPGVILGVGDWQKGSCKLFQMVWKGMPFYTEGINGYVDVVDVAKAMVWLMQENHMNQRFVLVSANMNMKWYLDRVASHLGKTKPTIRVNKFIAEVAWMAEAIKCWFTQKQPALTRETARASMRQYSYSSAKIEQLGFAFTPIEQTIAETCSQFLTTTK
jgi:nucleoside-diphosphate-sugar epimerase